MSTPLSSVDVPAPAGWPKTLFSPRLAGAALLFLLLAMGLLQTTNLSYWQQQPAQRPPRHPTLPSPSVAKASSPASTSASTRHQTPPPPASSRPSASPPPGPPLVLDFSRPCRTAGLCRPRTVAEDAELSPPLMGMLPPGAPNNRTAYLPGKHRLCWPSPRTALGFAAGDLICAPSVFTSSKKTGTSDLFGRLRLHPQILPPHRSNSSVSIGNQRNPIFKEPRFLGYPIMGDERFVEFFLHSFAPNAEFPDYGREDARMYDGSQSSTALVRSLVPQDHFRLIFLYRDPVDRLWSDAKMGIAGNAQKTNLQSALNMTTTTDQLVRYVEATAAHTEACLRAKHPLLCLPDISLNFVERGMYSLQLRRWALHFPPESILVVRTEDMGADDASRREAVYKGILAFLGLEQPGADVWRQMMLETVKNQRPGPVGKVPATCPPNLRRRLDRIYDPLRRDLELVLQTHPFVRV